MLLLRVRWLLTRFHDSQKQQEKDAHLKTSMDLMQGYQVQYESVLLIFAFPFGPPRHIVVVSITINLVSCSALLYFTLLNLCVL